MKRILLFAMCLSIAPIIGCSKADDTAVEKEKIPNPAVTIKMISGDIMRLELYPDIAPISVANFVTLAQEGFYDGVIFHRVIPGFMIQGGDPTGTGMGGPGYSIKGEFSANGISNELKHTRGVISMARSKQYDSAGSQFFIMQADTPRLDGSYAAFGKITDEESLKVVDAIALTKRDSKDKPLQEWKIETITVETYGVEYTVEKIAN